MKLTSFFLTFPSFAWSDSFICGFPALFLSSIPPLWLTISASPASAHVILPWALACCISISLPVSLFAVWTSLPRSTRESNAQTSRGRAVVGNGGGGWSGKDPTATARAWCQLKTIVYLVPGRIGKKKPRVSKWCETKCVISFIPGRRRRSFPGHSPLCFASFRLKIPTGCWSFNETETSTGGFPISDIRYQWPPKVKWTLKCWN